MPKKKEKTELELAFDLISEKAEVAVVIIEDGDRIYSLTKGGSLSLLSAVTFAMHKGEKLFELLRTSVSAFDLIREKTQEKKDQS